VSLFAFSNPSLGSGLVPGPSFVGSGPSFVCSSPSFLASSPSFVGSGLSFVASGMIPVRIVVSICVLVPILSYFYFRFPF